MARVTGGSSSTIDGTLRSDIAGASLFLISPSGVIFGQNARLDISDSFAATTADYVGLADGGASTRRIPYMIFSQLLRRLPSDFSRVPSPFPWKALGRFLHAKGASPSFTISATARLRPL
jgi:hypothetical protein